MKKRIALLAIIGITLLLGINQNTLSHADLLLDYMDVYYTGHEVDVIVRKVPATITICDMNDNTIASFTAMRPNRYTVTLNTSYGRCYAVYRSGNISEIDCFTTY